MKRGYPLPLLLSCFLLLIAAPAFAQKARPPVATPMSGTPFEVQIGKPLSNHVACTLGTSNYVYAIDWFLPPDDTYYTFLDKDACPSCSGPGGLILTNAHMWVYYPEACALFVEVSIVGANNADPSCPVPDLSNVICAPLPYVLDPTLGPGLYDWSMALPNACCITSDAFLAIKVTGFGACTSYAPQLVTDDVCDPCHSWNFYGPYVDEACEIGFPGNYSHYVESDCCESTPTNVGSWGRVKTLYR
jgi:hypothetical protein